MLTLYICTVFLVVIFYLLLWFTNIVGRLIFQGCDGGQIPTLEIF